MRAPIRLGYTSMAPWRPRRCAFSARRAKSSTMGRFRGWPRSCRTRVWPLAELRDVIKQMHDAKSDDGALAVVDEQRKALA